MQGLKTSHVSPEEWRWVFVVGGILAALTLLPYAWALASNATTTEWQFMGILANPQDGATYLAKIEQGMRGAWIFHFAHTPEAHTGAVINVFYLLLGHAARLIGVSSIVMFHLARVITTLFMFGALYQFGATVWPRIRPRRLFFGLVSVGSGLGWLALVLDPGVTSVPDLTVPEAYPLYSAYTNPHFPLAIGLLALLAASFVRVFRIDFTEPPNVANGGLEVIVLTFVLSLVQPQAMVGLGAALVVYLVVHAVRDRRVPVLEVSWATLFAAPALLMAAYYYAVLRFNPVMAAWNAQISNISASPVLVVLAYGLLLLAGVPGIIRAVRRFEEDGDQLMLIWLVVNFVLVFWPSNQQRRFMIGLIIPITFFAVRSLEDYWLRVVPQRWRYPALIALFVFVIPSNILALGIPLFGLINPQAGLEERLLVQRGYWDAMSWLARHGKPDDVVLSSPNIGLWIPAWGEKRVVYGHPWETLDARTKRAQVELWYLGQRCEAVLEQYQVRYVIVGPQERALGAGTTGSDACYARLGEISSHEVEFDGVTVYELSS